MKRPRGNIVLWILALVAISVGGGMLLVRQAKRLAATFAKAESEQHSLADRLQQLQAEVQTLQSERAALQETTQSMTADRDNLLAQAKRLTEEEGDLSAVTALHQRVLKRTVQENRALKGRLEPLEHDYDDLRKTYEALVKEREQLERNLADARAKSEEKRLKKALAKGQAAADKKAAELRDVQKRLKELEPRQAQAKAEIARLEGRLDALQKSYTLMLSQNKTLQYRSRNIPHEVTAIAREHERLVKDVADTHYNLGVVFAEKNDFVRASQEFQKVIELKPADGDALYNLGLIYAEHLPDRDKSTRYFERYLQLNPNARDASWVKRYISTWRAWEAKDRLE